MTQKDGFVLLYRKLIDSRIFKNEKLLKVAIWCLLTANHKHAWVRLKTGRGFTEVEVFPGQFIFGRFSAAKKLDMTPSGTWSRMKKLKTLQFIDIQPDTHYSIINIINWDGYQSKNKKSDKQPDRQVTTNQQPSDTNNNDNNENNLLPVNKTPETIPEKIYKFYNSEIQPLAKEKHRAVTNLKTHLKTHSESDLMEAVNNFKSTALEYEPRYRKKAANFFGVNEKPFLDYLPANYEKPKVDNGPRQPAYDPKKDLED